MYNQSRVIIENVSPLVNDGRFSVKAVVNEIIYVDADIIGDGHDIVAASVLYKHEKARSWSESRMQQGVNDSWYGSFNVEKQGNYQYKIQAWVDHALNWQHGIERKIDDGQHVNSELLEGAEILTEILKNPVTAAEKKYLQSCIDNFRNEAKYDKAISEARSQKLHDIFYKYPDKFLANETDAFPIYVDREVSVHNL